MGAEVTWAVVELLGHVRTAGRVTEEERFGGKLGRVDVPQADGTYLTQFFGAGSVYRVSVVTEAVARQVALLSSAAPVQPWDFPKALPAVEEPGPLSATRYHPHDDDRDDDDDRPF